MFQHSLKKHDFREVKMFKNHTHTEHNHTTWSVDKRMELATKIECTPKGGSEDFFLLRQLTLISITV